MSNRLVSGKGKPCWVTWGMVLAVSLAPLTVFGAERIVVLEEFTATW